MNNEAKNLKTISSSAESSDLIFETLLYNPISGETVPLIFFELRF
jgi:hypothetical protein